MSKKMKIMSMLKSDGEKYNGKIISLLYIILTLEIIVLLIISDYINLSQHQVLFIISALIVIFQILPGGIFSIYQTLAGKKNIDTLTKVVSIFSTVVNVIMMYAFIYKISGSSFSSGNPMTPTALDCLYFSIITWTNVGYRDLVPSEATRIIASSESLIAYMFTPFLIAAYLRIIDKREGN